MPLSAPGAKDLGEVDSFAADFCEARQASNLACEGGMQKSRLLRKPSLLRTPGQSDLLTWSLCRFSVPLLLIPQVPQHRKSTFLSPPYLSRFPIKRRNEAVHVQGAARQHEGER